MTTLLYASAMFTLIVLTKFLKAIIRKEGLNIPPNFDRDPHILKVVGMAIAEELTQAHSRLKKAVRLLKIIPPVTHAYLGWCKH